MNTTVPKISSLLASSVCDVEAGDIFVSFSRRGKRLFFLRRHAIELFMSPPIPYWLSPCTYHATTRFQGWQLFRIRQAKTLPFRDLFTLLYPGQQISLQRVSESRVFILKLPRTLVCFAPQSFDYGSPRPYPISKKIYCCSTCFCQENPLALSRRLGGKQHACLWGDTDRVSAA